VFFQAGRDPLCGSDGTLAATYSGTPIAAQGPPPPANAPDVVAWALSQKGRPYCWGGKGNVACFGNPKIPASIGGPYADRCPDRQGLPCWDCSGLTEAAYRAVSHQEIGSGTANQQHLPAVWRAGDVRDPASVAQAGDLLLFRGETEPGIVHVGMYMGQDQMVHAAYFPVGVIVTTRVFENRFYRPVLVLIVRPGGRS
jgi:cell wall-associated NlpC family hydrolase